MDLQYVLELGFPLCWLCLVFSSGVRVYVRVSHVSSFVKGLVLGSTVRVRGGQVLKFCFSLLEFDNKGSVSTDRLNTT